MCSCKDGVLCDNCIISRFNVLHCSYVSPETNKEIRVASDIKKPNVNAYVMLIKAGRD